MLLRRGVPAHAVDDVVQETATRALEHSIGFTDAEDLLRWCNTVAWRVALNDRRSRRRLSDAPLPERASRSVVENDALARYTLEAVAAVMPRLTDAERDALRPDAAPATSRKDAGRVYVRRHRARAHLIAMLDGLAGAVAWVGLVLRRSRPRAIAAALVPPAILLAFVLPRWVGGPAKSPAPERVTSGAAAADSRAAAAPSPSGVRPGVLADGRSGPAVAPASPRTGGVTLPPFVVNVPGNGGGNVKGRPKAPGDHLICWNTVVAGVRCADEPPIVSRLSPPG
jgi:hypothetical protein